jgi:hypothetical protein
VANKLTEKAYFSLEDAATAWYQLTHTN